MTNAPDIAPLVQIMEQLRTTGTGCAWDLEQTFETIAPYTVEEAYEVADAIERSDMEALKDELGDLLLQVVFHSRMASEQMLFGLQDVIDAICAKMVRRHPHIFSDQAVNQSDQIVENWETIKERERAGKGIDDSILADVALSLPSLLRAQKLQKRAARAGFDWPDVEGAFDKLSEEIGEVCAAETKDHQFEEIGDLLFAAVNISRHMGFDAETALKAANAKFEKRFRAMEDIAGKEFSHLPLNEKEVLWQQVKLKS